MKKKTCREKGLFYLQNNLNNRNDVSTHVRSLIVLHKAVITPLHRHYKNSCDANEIHTLILTWIPWNWFSWWCLGVRAYNHNYHRSISYGVDRKYPRNGLIYIYFMFHEEYPLFFFSKCVDWNLPPLWAKQLPCLQMPFHSVVFCSSKHYVRQPFNRNTSVIKVCI